MLSAASQGSRCVIKTRADKVHILLQRHKETEEFVVGHTFLSNRLFLFHLGVMCFSFQQEDQEDEWEEGGWEHTDGCHIPHFIIFLFSPPLFFFFSVLGKEKMEKLRPRQYE